MIMCKFRDYPPVIDVVIGSHTPTETPYVLGAHHLAREFNKAGVRCALVPIPLTLEDAFTPNRISFRQRRARLWIQTLLRDKGCGDEFGFISLIPWKFVRKFGRGWATRLGYRNFIVPSVSARIRSTALLIIDHPRQFWLVEAVKHRVLIYRPTDMYSHAGHKDEHVYSAIERWLISRADGLVLAARSLRPHLESVLGHPITTPVLIEENGVDLEMFLTHRASDAFKQLNDYPRPRLTYVGSIDDRFDVDFVCAAAAKFSELSFIIGGPILTSHRAKFRDLKNVLLLGPIPYPDIRQLFADCDVGLLPLSDHVANSTRSPMKLFEYAAAGLPVVYRNSGEIDARGLPFTFRVDSLNEFRDIVEKAMLMNPRDIRKLASERSWSAISGRLLEFANLLGAQVGDTL